MRAAAIHRCAAHARREQSARRRNSPGTREKALAWFPLVYDSSKRRELSAALAAAFLGGEWSVEALTTRGRISLAPRPFWLQEVAREVIADYPHPPGDRVRELAGYVELSLARRRSGSPAPHVRRWLPFEPEMGPTRWPVPELLTPGTLADRLELDPGQLLWLADARSWERDAADLRLRHYRYRWIPRPHAPARLVESPKARLKEIQRWILRQILDVIPAHDAAHGFVRGRSSRTHAALHTGRPVVVRIDLEDFFAWVTAGRVYGVFRTAGYPQPVAHLLTGLCVNVIPASEWENRPMAQDDKLLSREHRLGRRLAAPHLPQGAPTSPALATLAAFVLDVRLSALAASLELTYSRYADDLIFSGPRRATSALPAAVADIARDEGLRVNAGKTSVRSQGDRQLVGGSVVNHHVNVPRREYDALKAVLHDAALHGPPAANRHGVPDFRAHLMGRVAWVAARNPERGRRLRDSFDTIVW